MKTVAILGATGSIGVSTLEVVSAYPDRYRIAALTGGRNMTLLAEQIVQFRPEVVAVLSEEEAQVLTKILGADAPEILCGPEGLIRCAAHPDTDIVVSSIVGAAGLVPTMAAIEAGKDVALANKETLVTAGALVMRAVAANGVRLYPVDSEHSAIFQALEGHRFCDVRRLILTASGGPFLDKGLEELRSVTPAAALSHPNWDMGKKISIDSATMMNKGLEVIEARWLFDLDASRIAVHIHPQSIVHSMVEYVDGSVIAQMGIPDMKTPIAYALSYPERLPLDLPPLDLCQLGQLTFSEPDLERFRCLGLAYQALEAGGTAPAVLNAANEVAVASFLRGDIAFLDIARIIDAALQDMSVVDPQHIDEVLRADKWGREQAARIINSLNSSEEN
ncbi:MAG: 1-deoxy-D-xylulose-5-phosphate reductoisomerase [Desulfuromonadales bacterium]|nr:1-deoxy-D-xylulose-5-phosphate reductoisomerase [Desulfuromonadales bacterium]NIR34294.1 1-deoxy-D-xylulose-5-phosphate reductoisomerase [Desulfuromonadales bacterium]NIS42872.1 1-deoxy-D-xylulose-5-phosphate reductoisomerase [Desulfuromonadales bacterium]